MGFRPLLVPARAELASRLPEALGVASVDDVLALRDPQIFAWFPRLDGKTTAAAISSAAARAFYDGGTTLYVRNVAELVGAQREMATALGSRRCRSTASCSATVRTR